MTVAGLSEAELHGLVDGCLEPDRRADALRRASRSPENRQQIEAWQDQNELIRAAFVGVEREPLPRALNLQMPKLQAVDANFEPATLARRNIGSRQPDLSRRLRSAAVVSLVVVTGGATLWSATGVQHTGRTAAAAPAAPAKTIRSGIAKAGTMPIRTIPDLAAAGFVFVSADRRPTESADALVFRYKNEAAEQIVLVVAPVDAAEPARGIVWHDQGLRYALSGTVAPIRLRAVADTLQRTALSR